MLCFLQIYQLMKMDWYPRFKKSELAKECLLCEMEGRPLPMEASPQQPQKTQQSQYTGIWSKHRVGGALKSCDLMQMCILYCTLELYDLILAVFFFPFQLRSLVLDARCSVAGAGLVTSGEQHLTLRREQIKVYTCMSIVQ